jgi:large-conductance mechanosensitive channel
MNANLMRHKLLGILSKRFAFAENKNGETLGISLDNIYKQLKCEEHELRILISELLENKEIGYVDDDIIVGLHVWEKGVAAYSTKKYKYLFWKKLFSSIKLSVNIIIPILSFIISCIALYISIKANNSTNNKEQPIAKQQSSVQIRQEKKQQLELRIFH